MIKTTLSRPPLSRLSRPGTAAIEFAAVLPVLVTLIIGLWEGGRLIEIQQILHAAAREGGREAATGKSTTAQVQQIVVNYLAAAGIPTQNAVITITNQGYTGNPTPPNDDPTNATQLDQFHLTLTVPFNDVRWIALNIATNSSTKMTAEAFWSSSKDLPYPAVDYPAIE